jgi:GxxExxY protein
MGQAIGGTDSGNFAGRSSAQVLTYLKLTGLRVGLLMNFNVTSLRLGLRRFVR